MRGRFYIIQSIIIGSLFLMSILSANAQLDENAMTTKSTNASTFNNVNEDLFRGRISISIPIYTFNTKHLSTSISINYTPIDVNKIPSSLYHPGLVGLGWSLNAGGVITRSVRGVPDETATIGNLRNFNTGNYYGALPSDDGFENEEDEFSFSFGKHSGKFFFYRGEWIIFSNENFNFTCNTESGGTSIDNFTIITNDGNKYFFGGTNAIEYSQQITGGVRGINIPRSWYLTRIVSPDGDVINFEYMPDEVSQFYPITNSSNTSSYYKKLSDSYSLEYPISRVITNPSTDQIASTSTGSIISGIHLVAISSPTNNVSIKLNGSHTAIKNHPGLTDQNYAHVLNNIEFWSNSTIFKRYNLSYTESTVEALKLNSFQKTAISSTGTVSYEPAYTLLYIPETDGLTPNVLSKITYPTGGYTLFEFEENQLNVFEDPHLIGTKILANSPYGSYVAPNPDHPAGTIEYAPAGFHSYSNEGYRIKKQIKKESDNGQTITTNYYYTEEKPNIYTSKTYSTSGMKNRNSVERRIDRTAMYNGITYYAEKTTNYDNSYCDELPNTSISNTEYGYSSVWVVKSEDGGVNGQKKSIDYTNYHYTNYVTSADNGYICNNYNVVGKLTQIDKYDYNTLIPLHTISYIYKKGEVLSYQRYVTKSFNFIDKDDQLRGSANIGDYITRYFRYNISQKVERTGGISTTTNYTYDPITGNVTEQTVVESKFNYNVIGSNPDPNLYYNEDGLSKLTTSYLFLTSLNANTSQTIQNIPSEIVTKRDGSVIAASYIKYALFGNATTYNILRPAEVYELDVVSPITDFQPYNETTQSKDLRYKLKKTMMYDDYGNLIQSQNIGSTPIAYYYSNVYNTHFDSKYNNPSLVAINCSYSTLSAAVTSLDINNIDDINKLRKLLPTVQINSSTFDFRFGETSSTSPNGITTYQEYDSFGRVSKVKDTNNNIVKKIEYGY